MFHERKERGMERRRADRLVIARVLPQSAEEASAHSPWETSPRGFLALEFPRGRVEGPVARASRQGSRAIRTWNEIRIAAASPSRQQVDAKPRRSISAYVISRRSSSSALLDAGNRWLSSCHGKPSSRATWGLLDPCTS